jgi:hypothetical protein
VNPVGIISNCKVAFATRVDHGEVDGILGWKLSTTSLSDQAPPNGAIYDQRRLAVFDV